MNAARRLDGFVSAMLACSSNALVLLTILFLMLPILVVIPISFSSARYLTFPPPGYSLQWYRELIERPEWGRALWVSVQVACLCTGFSLALGVAASFALVRGRFRSTAVLYAFILSPMILPSVIVGLGTFFLLSRFRLTGSILGLALAHTVVVTPIVVIIVSATLQGFDRRLEQAALIFGATPLRTFVSVTLPIISPSVVSAGLFAFLLSFDDVLISLFIADPSSATLPIQIWNNTIMQISPTIAAVSTALLGVCLLVLSLVALLRSIQR